MAGVYRPRCPGSRQPTIEVVRLDDGTPAVARCAHCRKTVMPSERNELAPFHKLPHDFKVAA